MQAFYDTLFLIFTNIVYTGAAILPPYQVLLSAFWQKKYTKFAKTQQNKSTGNLASNNALLVIVTE